jgi:hypothetical protein
MTSFDVTFLGHQGWLVSSGEGRGDSRLLIDPLLTRDNGHGGSVAAMFPPRRFSFEAFPPLTAVFFTHEHEDHFDIASLQHIDRAVPVLLSARSSTAAVTILTEMGFGVRRVHAGEVIELGELVLSLFAPDTKADVADEWDVLPYLVHDRRGHGSFFSSVDVSFHPKIERALAKLQAKPGVWAFTNNAMDFSCMAGGDVVLEEPLDSAAAARKWLEEWSGLAFRWGTPVASLFCGGGMSFSGERAWLNRNVFRAHSEDVAKAMSTLLPGQTFLVPRPGETLSLVDGVVTNRRPHSAFLSTPPESEWPSRQYVGDVSLLGDYAPFTEARDLTPDELGEMERELAGFAAFLYGSKIFRDLLALDTSDLGGRRPTISLVLLCDDEGGSYTYEYDATACAFVDARGDDPVADYVGGLECWASDLLAVFRGDISVGAIMFGRGRTWTALPEDVGLSFMPLCLYAHPLRRPDRALSLYRRLRDASASSPVVTIGR